MEQIIITDYAGLDNWLLQNKAKTIMLVCGKSIERQRINEYFQQIPQRLGITVVPFMGFAPNPQYESVCEGIKTFHEKKCDTIVAVGGGSAMDVAKCIKLFSNMEAGRNYLEQIIMPNSIPFLAMPTTAGTGSEATRFAVIYYQGAKQSVADPSCIPGAVFLDSSSLKTLPEYQKKATMMDAFSHALESYWSINSTEESKAFSRSALRMIIDNMDGYLSNTEEGNRNMLLAANIAGKAINITQTTAGHAMCYKITSLYGCAHGHAAFLCNRVLFPWMIRHTEDCIDPRGKEYLNNTFLEIAQILGSNTPEDAAEKLNARFLSLDMQIPKATAEDYAILRSSVNPVRLKNHPIYLSTDTIDLLYHDILREKT